MSNEQPIDFNEPRESEYADDQGKDYEPSEKDLETIRYVRKIFGQSKAWREPYVQNWQEYYQCFRGKQWKAKRPSYRHSEVINLIFMAIQNQVPLMTDARPKVEFIATEPNDVPLVEIMNDLFTSDWEKNDWNYTLLECLYDSHIYGIGLAGIDFDENEDMGLGGITWRSLEPVYGYPEPGSSDINTQRKCGWFVYAEPLQIDKIKAKWPRQGEFVKTDINNLWAASKTELNNSRYEADSYSRDSLDSGTTSSDSRNKGQALVQTVFCRPIDVVEEEITRDKDDDSGEQETVFQTRLKHPRGRKIVIAGNVVLEDDKLDADDKSIPIQKIVNYCDPRCFYGIGDVEQQLSPQRIFNKIVSFTLDVLTLTGNPIWVIDTESGVDPDNLFNIPGAVVEKEPGTEVRREAGTQLQPYVIQMIDRTKLWFDDVSGSQEVTRGSNPSGVTAARAIEALQETGRTRIRQKTRNMDNFLREFGRQYIQCALQNYTVPRVRRVIGKDGAQRYFKFSTERIQNGDKLQTVIQTVQLKKNQDSYGNIGYIPDESTRIDRVLVGEFDVRVSTVSGLPFAKAEAEQKLFRLREMEIIDDEELLRGIEFPNVDALIQRIKQRKLEASQQPQPQQ